MNMSLIVGLGTFIIGAIYSIQANSLPLAKFGNPIAPKLFPLGVGLIITVLGLALVIQEIKKNGFKFVIDKNAKIDKTVKLIISTCFASILYALIFNKAGYVISTIVFLGIILYLFNGKEKWQRSILVAVVFSVVVYLIFSKLLGIILPSMPVLNI